MKQKKVEPTETKLTLTLSVEDTRMLAACAAYDNETPVEFVLAAIRATIKGTVDSMRYPEQV